jgi:hypothetical protein
MLLYIPHKSHFVGETEESVTAIAVAEESAAIARPELCFLDFWGIFTRPPHRTDPRTPHRPTGEVSVGSRTAPYSK